MENNPLKNYFRKPKTYIKLPSGIHNYNESVIKDPSVDEIGILPMTAADEVMLKNPEALLNGKAIESVIGSCCPDIVNVKKIAKPDIDTIMIAIRYASFGNNIEISGECPKCNHENEFIVDTEYKLNTIKSLEDEYSVTTPDGVKIILRPFNFEESLIAQKAQFEQYKLNRKFDDAELSDEERLHMFSNAIESITSSSVSLLISSVKEIITPDDQSVTDHKHIAEFITNVDRSVYKSLNETLEVIGETGVSTTHKAKCEKCDHDWNLDIDYNPVNFFTES